jgi:hypothetical protein
MRFLGIVQNCSFWPKRFLRVANVACTLLFCNSKVKVKLRIKVITTETALWFWHSCNQPKFNSCNYCVLLDRILLFRQFAVLLFNKLSQRKTLFVWRRMLSFSSQFSSKANRASANILHSFELPRAINVYPRTSTSVALES